jgi:hypothetical protein
MMALVLRLRISRIGFPVIVPFTRLLVCAPRSAGDRGEG